MPVLHIRTTPPYNSTFSCIQSATHERLAYSHQRYFHPVGRMSEEKRVCVAAPLLQSQIRRIVQNTMPVHNWKLLIETNILGPLA